MNENKESIPISRFVEVNKALIHALDWGGSGTPLLLVHGAMRTGRSWNAVARRLRDTYRVISVDIRGHGDSGATVDGNDTSSRMKDILAISQALKLGPHFVMAHSLGAIPSGMYCARMNHLVKALILIEPMIDMNIFWKRGEKSKSKWLANPPMAARMNSLDNMEELVRRIRKNDATKNWTEEVLADVLNEEIRALPDGRVEVKWDRSIYNLEEMWNDNNSLIVEAPNIDMPVLVVVREENQQINTTVKALVDSLPDSKLMKIDSIGHSMYMENPDMVAQMAREWFA